MKRSGIFWLLVAVLVFSGCQEEPKRASQPAQSKKVTKPAPKREVAKEAAEPDEEQEPREKYRYDPTDRRDPFRPLVEVKKQVPVREKQVPLTPLQKFSLEELRLIGIIVGKGESKAMVVAPDQKSYILKVGTKVGKNNGTVVAVKPDGVVVREKYYDFSGDIRENERRIGLPEREGER